MKNKQDIRQKIALHILRRKTGKTTRNKTTMNFDKAASALLLIDGTDSTSKKEIDRFISFIKQNNIQVECIYFYNTKEAPVAENATSTNLSKKNLNFLGLPKQQEVEPILNKEYDILIDLSMTQYLALQSIVALSTARFKIGMLPGNSDHYDFMINLGESISVSAYIEQIKKYLPLL